MAFPLTAVLVLALASSLGVQAADDETQATLQGPAQLRLGFMLPFPFGDSAIPPRLADEWLSAAKLALVKLGPGYERYFTLQYYVTNSNCSRESAEYAARALQADGVHAVVGPACSESVIGANTVFHAYNIPFISFAATADLFSHGPFPTLFRTAFPDVYQGRAMAAVVHQLKLTNLYLFYSNETYGLGLNKSIQDALASFGVNIPVVAISVPHPPPSTTEGYQVLFSGVELDPSNSSTGVILATGPKSAQGLLQAALALNKTAYPWWYIGSDGTVSFDLVGGGEDLKGLAAAIQGELGVGPYDGVNDAGVPEAGFSDFWGFWAQQSYSTYPGLLALPSTPRITRPRPYVVHLIDAIWTFLEVAKMIVQSTPAHTLNKVNMLDCLRGMGPCAGQSVSFQGASGWVAFNTSSGERLTNPPNVPPPTMFGVENLVGMTWQYKGSWSSGQVTGLSGSGVLDLSRPGPIPPGTPVIPNTVEAPKFDAPEDLLAYAATMDAQENQVPPGQDVVYVYSNKMSTGTMVALIILSTLLAFTAIGAIIQWQRSRRNRDHANYGRMI